MMISTTQNVTGHIRDLQLAVGQLEHQLLVAHQLNTVLLHKLGGQLTVCAEEITRVNCEFPYIDLQADHEFTSVKLCSELPAPSVPR